MSDQRDVWIKDRVKVDIKDGGSYAFKVCVVFLLCCIAFGQCSAEMRLSQANDLRKQRLEIAKRQYQLDSLRYYAPTKQR